FWFIAFIVTISSAIYQRMTGPNYPVYGKITIQNTTIKYKLKRTHAGTTDHEVTIPIANANTNGYIEYKRYKTSDNWTKIEMTEIGDKLVGYLPNQPPAGKLMYKVYLKTENGITSLSGEKPVIIRYRGSVPALIMIPHIIIMFAAMFISNRSGIAALEKNKNLFKYTVWSISTLFIGGLILGPLVQKYAFGALWTGFPFGHDLTDNKTLIAFLGWLVALIKIRKSDSPNARWYVLAASLILLAIYLIPHSVLGSELDYSQLEQQ
ncbi:hypothetical protein JW964_14240, partial [candidate division KSB1 bacterium]|nr:hypothetical protein [candidate division KSB1 bacterium]